MTHFTCFDRAGTKRTKMPWWLDEGIASFVARKFDADQGRLGLGARDGRRVAGRWRARRLGPDGGVRGRRRWSFGGTSTRRATRWSGSSRRGSGETSGTQWLAKMATEMDIDAATPAVLGMSFEDLDKAFREWLTQVH